MMTHFLAKLPAKFDSKKLQLSFTSDREDVDLDAILFGLTRRRPNLIMNRIKLCGAALTQKELSDSATEFLFSRCVKLELLDCEIVEPTFLPD